MMAKQYRLDSNTSNHELVALLKNAINECDELSAMPAIMVINFGRQKDREKVIKLQAAKQILSNILWCIDIATREGFDDPTFSLERLIE